MRNYSSRYAAVFVLASAAAAAALWIARGDAEAADQTIGTVSYLQGPAQRARGSVDKWSQLQEKASVFQGDRLKTGDDARLEATLADGSKLRLAANSELNLEKMDFSKKKATKTVKAKLVIGRLWASVTKLLSTESKFEVNTGNAVAGVRGTRFTAAKEAGGQTTVKVYSGQVLVSNQPIYAVKGHTKANRVEVAGPQEVSKNQWEELVAGAMQMVTVAANGDMQPPASFAMAEPGKDDWEAWNGERDKVAGLNE
ncbi:MAG: FecR domain-containing protein [Deltaproteobacteria bacterium]|nr:FecR domain-containing protein [Deltaproteobacteria bacterium]